MLVTSNVVLKDAVTGSSSVGILSNVTLMVTLAVSPALIITELFSSSVTPSDHSTLQVK